MAKGQAVPRELAIKQALRVLTTIQPFCERVPVVAGSIRRLRPTVHDIDIVAQADPAQMVRMAVALTAVVDPGTLKLAPKIWHAMMNGITLDLYLADAKSYGMLVLVRTGSPAHNIKLASLAKRQGMRLHFDGYVEVQGKEPIWCAEEDQVFSALGLDFVAPELREA